MQDQAKHNTIWKMWTANCDMGQGIQEWTKQDFWNTAFKNFEVIHKEISDLTCCTNQMTGFHIERNTGFKWIKME